MARTRIPVVIDGKTTEVSGAATLAAVVSPQVQSITTVDGRIVKRQDFEMMPVPAGMSTNLSDMVLGQAESLIACGQTLSGKQR